MKDQIKIWIDALEFQETGGWKTDTQYVHLMGCGYLLAANEPGVPVADAKTVINVPKKDTYRIWIRTRNWLRPHNPGRFSLLVNGEENWSLREGGCLADIAPTLIELMGLEQPKEMNGKSLLTK